jgi:lipopolysaccharide export system protein LptA
VLTVVCLKAAISATTAYAKDEKLNPGKNRRNNQTYISADKLVTDNNTKSAEFTGNVKATQGDTVITADRLKIFYIADKKKDQRVTGEEAIQKIIATGTVTIRFGDVLAKTRRAVYTKETRTIVLTGANSWIGDGKNSVAGSTITLYMDDKRISASSGKSQRVEAVFQTGID